MESKQYRIMRMLRSVPMYKLIVTHGLLDTELIGYYAKQADARAAAKRHAERTGCKPIILT